MSGVYWINAMTALLASILVFLVLPETSKMSLVQLDTLFKKPSSSSSSTSFNKLEVEEGKVDIRGMKCDIKSSINNKIVIEDGIKWRKNKYLFFKILYLYFVVMEY